MVVAAVMMEVILVRGNIHRLSSRGGKGAAPPVSDKQFFRQSVGYIYRAGARSQNEKKTNLFIKPKMNSFRPARRNAPSPSFLIVIGSG